MGLVRRYMAVRRSRLGVEDGCLNVRFESGAEGNRIVF